MCRGMTKTASNQPPLANELSAQSEIDVARYLRHWLCHARGRVRAVTYEGYEVLLRRHAVPRFGHLRLHELRALDVQSLYGELLAGSAESPALSAGTVLNLHLVLTQALGQAVRWQLLAANPAAGAQPPRPRRAAPLGADPALLERLAPPPPRALYELPRAPPLAARV